MTTQQQEFQVDPQDFLEKFMSLPPHYFEDYVDTLKVIQKENWDRNFDYNLSVILGSVEIEDLPSINPNADLESYIKKMANGHGENFGDPEYEPIFHQNIPPVVANTLDGSTGEGAYTPPKNRPLWQKGLIQDWENEEEAINLEVNSRLVGYKEVTPELRKRVTKEVKAERSRNRKLLFPHLQKLKKSSIRLTLERTYVKVFVKIRDIATSYSWSDLRRKVGV